MLQHLSITNYAIIEHLELEIQDGFTVITGETGAGKSILLGALSLILGQRADTSVLNDKDKKCIVEGTFKIKNNDKFKEFFTVNDLDLEEINIIRREINSKGSSRAFINDSPVGLAILKEFTSQLINIHSQHQTLQIQDAKFQVGVVDAFAEIEDENSQYTVLYKKYTQKKRELEELSSKKSTKKSDLDYVLFQIKEIEELDLKPNEQKQIEAQLEIINNAEEIKSVLNNTSAALTNTDKSALEVLNNVTTSFSKISDCSDEYKQLYERLNSLTIELADVAREIELLNNNTDFDPENAEYLNNRLNTIYSLEQKHHLQSSDELLELLVRLKSQVSDVDSLDETIDFLEKELVELENSLRKLAETISRKRTAVFNALTTNITKNLSDLGMSDASLVIKHEVNPIFTEIGIDQIEFLFSANKGVEVKELNKAASGGELSRLMLTIKAILAKSVNLSSIVFDEIDTGVSGDIADKMGEIMKQMSSTIQVLSITHLPQVAAKGEFHLKVYKETVSGKTLTRIEKLNDMDRVEEIAKMLSGKELTEAAMENAKNLIHF